MTMHEEISRRAREIWEREGCPQGRDLEHWLLAEAELRSSTTKPQSASRVTPQESEITSQVIAREREPLKASAELPKASAGLPKERSNGKRSSRRAR